MSINKFARALQENMTVSQHFLPVKAAAETYLIGITP